MKELIKKNRELYEFIVFSNWDKREEDLDMVIESLERLKQEFIKYKRER